MNKKPKTMILTAGPKRSKNEVRYVVDAVKYGWNTHHSDYIKKFEHAFAAYLGVRYALAMSTGTSALHVGLILAGVTPGDEVIIPDFTYVACANVVHYIGAKPVLVDVDSETWSIDTSRVEQYITKKTKAIMPVHLYGNVADMDGICRIAKKYHLAVVEDACEGLGCSLNGKKIGTQSDIAGFSFQGAKLLAIGEGGMLVTNNKDWYEHACSIVDHGIDFSRQFWAKEIGYMYPLSNIQAAIGLARLEEIDELVARKRRIFHWYMERLSDIEGIAMNPSRLGLESSYWMSSIILGNKSRRARDQIRQQLRDHLIDTRPFFFPISSFGFYPSAIQTPISHRLSATGINLPSGVLLKEKEVDYIASTVKKILH